MLTWFPNGTSIISIQVSVKILGINLHNGLNFTIHIDTICKSASNQWNTLVRLKKKIKFWTKEGILVNSFILWNFGYCSLVSSISFSKSLNNIKNLNKYALRFLQNDQHSYYKILLQRSWKTTVNSQNLRNLCKVITISKQSTHDVVHYMHQWSVKIS